MKKLVLISIIALLTAFPFTNLLAQYDIPSYDLELTGTSISFEEDHQPGITICEERDLIIQTTDTPTTSSANAKVLIYKLGSLEQYGPFNIIEDVTFEFAIDEDEWGVMVVEYSSDCRLSVWAE